MSDKKLPANIRQIGTMNESGISIFVEDFVCTYLRQLADSGGKCEMLAYLVGKVDNVDGRDCVFISGALAGKYSKYIDGMETFTEKSEKYAEDMLNLYFPGYEIVGWMQSQPGYGCAVNPAYADLHMGRFTKPYHVLFVMDPAERLNAFYAWDEAMTGLSERSGYIIYYDKNDGMREYMLDNKLSPKRGGAKPNGTPDERDAARTPRESAKSASGGGKGVIAGLGRSKEGGEYRKVVNMLVSLSAVLFIICFIMGAGLIQADGRVGKLENEVASLDATYGFLVAQAKNGATQDVFAANDNTPPLTFSDSSYNSNVDAFAILEPETHPEDVSAGLPDIDTSYNDSQNTITTDNTAQNTDTIASDRSPEPIASPAAVTPPPATEPTGDRGAQAEDPGALTRSQAEYDTYVVEQGDSLLSISWKFYGSADRVRDIMELNNIAEADLIFYGKKLKLPK